MNIQKKFRTALLVVVSAFGFIGLVPVFAAVTPSLGAAATYGILASTYTNTTAGTTVNGDVGFTTGPAVVPAGTHTNYGSGAPYSTAGTDQGNALAALALEPCTFTFADGAINLSTDATHGAVGIYTPGVYCSVGAMNIGGPLTLSGSGTYIFRPDGALTSTAGAVVTLADASACDVFWTPTGATTLAANTTFFGTNISQAGITVGANTIWEGRALAFGGTVTTDTTTITVPNCTPAPATLHVIKQVVNDSGGTAVASDFIMHVKLSGTDVAGSPSFGNAVGTDYSLAAGTYIVSEEVNASYVQSFSGDCDSNGSVTLAAGADKTCTITNDDIAPVLPATINVVKTVINDNGGTQLVSDFPLFVNGTSVISGVTNIFPAPFSYAVTETSDAQYTQVFSGDCDINGMMNLVPGDDLFCIVTNDDRAVGGGGGLASEIASAVQPVLPVLPVPPLINVVKVPSPLALPDGPGPVTYTYTLSNIGTVPVTDITMVGDTCSPIVLVSGDTNNDARLDVNESWIYSCSTTLTETHKNTIVATGWANGISAVDIASATVVVGEPVVPPLIHVVKVPSPLTLSAEGGIITYTVTIRNPGITPLQNIILTDNMCSPVTFISGDTNGDDSLDTSEAWTYTCFAHLTRTMTNTAVASGEANGFIVRDFAIVPVVVAATSDPVSGPVSSLFIVPGLPNTGFAPTKK